MKNIRRTVAWTVIIGLIAAFGTGPLIESSCPKPTQNEEPEARNKDAASEQSQGRPYIERMGAFAFLIGEIRASKESADNQHNASQYRSHWVRHIFPPRYWCDIKGSEVLTVVGALLAASFAAFQWATASRQAHYAMHQTAAARVQAKNATKQANLMALQTRITEKQDARDKTAYLQTYRARLAMREVALSPVAPGERAQVFFRLINRGGIETGITAINAMLRIDGGIYPVTDRNFPPKLRAGDRTLVTLTFEVRDPKIIGSTRVEFTGRIEYESQILDMTGTAAPLTYELGFGRELGDTDQAGRRAFRAINDPEVEYSD